jgi:hypothetical protein
MSKTFRTLAHLIVANPMPSHFSGLPTSSAWIRKRYKPTATTSRVNQLNAYWGASGCGTSSGWARKNTAISSYGTSPMFTAR